MTNTASTEVIAWVILVLFAVLWVIVEIGLLARILLSRFRILILILDNKCHHLLHLLLHGR